MMTSSNAEFHDADWSAKCDELFSNVSISLPGILRVRLSQLSERESEGSTYSLGSAFSGLVREHGVMGHFLHPPPVNM